jgi:hypothetical protein
MIRNFTKLALGGFLIALFCISCKKTTENVANPGGTSSYTIDGTPGSCASPVIGGQYAAGITMNASNTLTFTVNVTTKGTYGITTTGINGVWFSGSGTFTSIGPQQIILTGNGTPLRAGNFSFVPVTNNTCNFTLSFSAGASPAVFSYAGAPGSCAAPSVNGTYKSGIGLGSGNYVDLAVNVSTPGAYTVSTNSVNGISFSGSGSFSTAGAQVLRLIGNGTPATPGTFTFTPSNNGCSFNINVTPGGSSASFTYNGGPGSCTSPVVNGTYTAGTALNASNTIVLGVNVTVAGSYSVTTNNSNGVTFSASGVFASVGANTITLTSTNTPTAAGTFMYTPTGGCSVSITYTGGGGGGDYIKCTIDGVFIDFSTSIAASLMPGTFAAVGDDITGNKSFEIDVIDLMGGNITAGTYSKLSPTNTNKYCDPYYTPDNGNPGDYWATDPLNANIFTVVIQTITANRVTGTFSGDLFDNLGANKKVITLGTFSVPY